MGSQGGGPWAQYHSHGLPPQSQPQEADGTQMRPMGLKVNYTFERDQQNCLARWPHTLQIQTVPVDERTTIGVVDLRICLQAIAQCSPEIVNQPDKDYAVYALDYSEDDIPLVGQGMLSWGLDQTAASPEQKLVTGRVTKNMLAIFGNGIKETLEVKLKLNSVPRMQRPQTSHNSEMQRGYGSNAPTPTPTDTASEWSSFMQSNPGFGRPTNGPSMPSPNLAPARFGTPIQMPSPAPDSRPEQFAPLPAAPTPPPPGATGPQPVAPMSSFASAPSSQGPPPENASASSKSNAPGAPAPTKKPKRSSSKAPNKKKTGNPRGRPPKRPRQDAGDTSALEDATDGDEPAKKKRAKTTKADWPKGAPLDSAPGSLRVAASTSGSLRTMRPAASGPSGVGGSHLQEIPRAPTPVPGQAPPRPLSKPLSQAQSRRPSVLGYDGSTRYQVFDGGIPGPPGQDARSPSESIAQSPQQAYTPEESPADIGSSPPVPRSARSMRSSPPLSSPVLPPMPMPQPDSGFMSGGFDSLADYDDIALANSLPPRSEDPSVAEAPRPGAANRPKAVTKAGMMIIEQVCPGPPELLPQQSIYKPKSTSQALSKKPRGTASEPPAPEAAALQSIEDPEDGILRLLDQPMADGLPTAHSMEEAHALPAMSEPPRFPSHRPSTADATVSAAKPPVAASDPGVPEPTNLPYCSFEEEEDQAPPSKNISRKQSIKAKLEKAIEAGQMPTFCSNCGAISTPTWRKVYSQHCEGSPEFPVFSDKPGCITAIIITKRDENEKPLEYQVIKKALGPTEDKSKWSEDMLCNSCGIWLSKFKNHRPEDRWEADPAQIGKPRKKNNGKSRPKKGKAQNKGTANLTSEAYFTTDPIGPPDEGSSPENGEEVMLLRGPTTEPPSRERGSKSQSAGPSDSLTCSDRRGSSKSQDNGMAQAPAAEDTEDLGRTRRLLFPSPKKDGQPKVLGEVAINIVKTSPSYERSRKVAMEQENMYLDIDGDLKLLATPKPGARTAQADDDMADLFGTPPRPSTPPPMERNNGHFKTPTRPTPSHRPITRSVSKSIRSARSVAKSPGHALHTLQQTPTKTPRVSSAMRRIAQQYDLNSHSTQHLHAHFSLDHSDMGMYSEAHGLSMSTGEYDSPFSSTLNQLLSEAHDFTTGSSAHGLGDLDLASLPNLDSDTVLSGHLETLDFGHFLTTDTVMPSSPPLISKQGGGGTHVSFESASQTGLDGEGVSWESFGEAMMADGGEGE
ncbi:hypothetical protein J7T55_003555 [Diaporthe amygdali]|uniref:uncharacterized protein n=1 Tax=Phomopsis amygdali TaxID=1214568 RepID=UPI0022FEB983|nr:uncharacterized protein J7T55_003555 [Diaporthe amygdali]KAJ0117138.1 hypothetical protein J7T55_003555 [Diaporthe amygdali]